MMNNFNKTYWIALSLLSILFYILNCFTPYFSDDWHFGFMIGEDRDIETLNDVLVSNYRHYLDSNGRFVCHFVLMIFAGLLKKAYFNVFNVGMFAAFQHLMVVNFSPSCKHNLKVLIVSSFLTVSIMCGFRYTFLWMSGVMNYEFVAVLILLFYYLLQRSNLQNWMMPLLLLIGIIVGWTNEALIVGFGIGCLFVYIRHLKKISMSQWFLFCGFAIGALLCVLSPGSIYRALGEGNSTNSFSLLGFATKWASSLFYMKNLRLFWLMLIGVILTRKAKTLWLVAALSSFLFVSLTGFHNENSRFGIELFSLILILDMIPYDRFSKGMSWAIYGANIAYMLACLWFCKANYDETKSVEKQIISNTSGLIATNEVKPPFWAQRLVLPFTFDEEDNYYCCYDKNAVDPKNIARYYKCDHALSFLPQKFIFDALADRVGYECDVNADYPFYACRVSETDSIDSVTMQVSPSPFANYPLLNRMKQFTLTSLDAEYYCMVEIAKRHYLVIKKNSLLKDRINRVNVVNNQTEKDEV